MSLFVGKDEGQGWLAKVVGWVLLVACFALQWPVGVFCIG